LGVSVLGNDQLGNTMGIAAVGTPVVETRELALLALVAAPRRLLAFEVIAVAVQNPATGRAFVRHQANAPSGGQVTDVDIGAFLSGPRHPEQDALLRLIGSSILDRHAAAGDAEMSGAAAGREWSEAELSELGDMLVRGLTIEEITYRLRRDHREVRDKAAEVGRACRGAATTISDPAEDQFAGNLRELWTALRLIRETVEELAPPGSIPNDEYLTPEPMREAEAIIRGIYAIAGEPSSAS
jgi:hypothetical protein